METALIQLKKLLKHQKKMRKIYDECKNKTYCEGDQIKIDSYNVSRLESWENIKALQIAIKIIKNKLQKK